MVRPYRKLKKIFIIMGAAGAVYGTFRYLLPLVVPFLFAYMAALWLRRPVRYLERRLAVTFHGKSYHLSGAVIGGLLLLLLEAGAVWLIYLGGICLFKQLENLSSHLPGWLYSMETTGSVYLMKLEARLGLSPGILRTAAKTALRQLAIERRSAAMPILMANSMNILRRIAKMLIVVTVFSVSAVMTISEMEELREWRSRSDFHRELTLLSRRLFSVGSVWLRTQVVIMLITSMICTAGLFLIGNPYSLLLGLGIGLLDALPFFGTGSVLIPYGIFLLVRREWGKAAIIIGMYAVCYLLREFLEAKLMGSRMGLSPLETFIAMYVGLELFGIPGFILGPMGLLLTRDLVDIYDSNLSAPDVDRD